MAWSITDLFPPWGDSGEVPPDNFQYDGGDQVNEKHFDYLWNSLQVLEDDVRSALTDIDSDSDGKVDAADSADDADTVDGEHASAFADSGHTHPGGDITSQVSDADTVDGEHASAFADSSHTHPGSDITSQVGDADTVDGEHASAFADAGHTHPGSDITSQVSDSDTVDGYHATELQGGLNLPSADIASGDFTALARFSFPAGKTLTVTRASILNGSFNSPAGLNLIVYDQTNNTTLDSFNGYSEPGVDLDVGGKDVVIAADNGNFGGGSGSDQTNVTAVLDGIIN